MLGTGSMHSGAVPQQGPSSSSSRLAARSAEARGGGGAHDGPSASILKHNAHDHNRVWFAPTREGARPSQLQEAWQLLGGSRAPERDLKTRIGAARRALRGRP